LGQSLLDGYQNGLDELYDGSTETIHSKKHFEIARKLIDELRTEIDEPLKSMGSLKDTYKLCLELIEDYLDGTKDRMISIVDKDARLAHKSAGNIKRGYKDQIIIDEDSEIILASLQTPFNVGDEKGLQALVNQVKENFKIKPKELSADKVYGTIENREFLDKKGIKANINFYNEREKENKCLGYPILSFLITSKMLLVQMVL
jgi:IS5 family transposase